MPAATRYPPTRPLLVREKAVVLRNLGLARQGALRVAWAMAHAYAGGGQAAYRQFFGELIDAAWVGLCLAAQRYDPAAGNTFGTFAFQVVRGAVGQASLVARNVPPVKRLGVDGRGGINPAVVRCFTDCRRPRGRSDGPEHAVEVLDPRPGEPDPDDAPAALHPELAALLALMLRPRDCAVLRRVAIEDATLEAAAAELGVTKQRAQQLYARAVRTLRGCPAFLDALGRQLWRRKRELSAVDFGRSSNVATLFA